MSSRIIAAVQLLVMLIYAMPSAMANNDAVPEDEHPESTADYDRSPDVAVTGISFSNRNSPKEGGLFELPIIGTLDSFGIRYASARSNIGGLAQQALFAEFRTPWAWSTWGESTTSLRLSFEAGRFLRDSEKRYFASFGPSVRISSGRWRTPLFIDLGLSPTVIGGSNYGDEDLGTTLNFTSHIGIGMKFGRTKRHEIKLRYQHISNGGLDRVNPGLNMIGLDFVFWGRGH
jgi:hypothetical protein